MRVAISKCHLDGPHPPHPPLSQVTRIVFVVNVLIALIVLIEFVFFSEWPQGSFFFCQLPYMVSIASFKSFSVPMYYALTVTAHFTFSESTFGCAAAHREPSGSLDTSPLPRDPVSLAALAVTAVLFLVWFGIMVVNCIPVIIAFAPVLLVPGFVLPMLVMYGPSLGLEAASTALRRKFKIPVVLAGKLPFNETVLILKGATTQVRLGCGWEKGGEKRVG